MLVCCAGAAVVAPPNGDGLACVGAAAVAPPNGDGFAV